MTDDTNGNGQPAPHCPMCGTEMVLTIEHRDGDETDEGHRVWVCPNADEHRPPPGWWEQISPP